MGTKPDEPANPLANATYVRLTDFEGAESDAAISRDGKFVVFRSDRDGPSIPGSAQIGSGRFVNLTHGTQGSVLIRNGGFTPDGSEVWLSGIIGGARLRLVPLTGGTPRAFLTEHAINLAWSPDGSTIAFHTYDTGDPLFVSDATGANPRQIHALDPGGHLHFPTWSSDGQWLYFVAGVWDARQMDVWRIRPSGGAPERLTTHNADVRFLAPLDARTLLYVAPDQNGAGPWLWSVDVERKVSRRVSSGIERYTSVESSADGRRLVATMSNPTANLWSLPLVSDRLTGEQDVRPFSVPTVRAFAPRFGGTTLFYLSSRGGGDGLWRYADGQSTEVWRGADGALLEPGAISSTGNVRRSSCERMGSARFTRCLRTAATSVRWRRRSTCRAPRAGRPMAAGSWQAAATARGRASSRFRLRVATRCVWLKGWRRIRSGRPTARSSPTPGRLSASPVRCCWCIPMGHRPNRRRFGCA